MIRRLTLTNFMSHKETVIDFDRGLTVLVGDNNCGKSAIVAALEIVCRNATGDYMIRHGESHCEIKLETLEGDEIVWQRGRSKSVRYIINGVERDRLRGKPPEELHKILKMPLVESENSAFDIHFGMQKDPIFLLGDVESKRATFFASSSDAAKLLEMQARHKDKTRAAKGRNSDLEKREAILLKQKEAFEGLTEISKSADELEQLYASLTGHCSDLTKLSSLVQNLEAAERNQSRFKSLSDCLQKLGAPPELQPANRLASLIGDFDSTIEKREINTRCLGELKGLAPPPKIDSVKSLRQLIGSIGSTQKKSATLSSRCSKLKGLTGPPVLQNEAKIKRLLDAYSRSQNRVKLESKKLVAVGELAAPPALESPRNLETMIRKLNSKQSQCESLKKSIKQFGDLEPIAEPSNLQQLSELLDEISKQVNTMAIREIEVKEAVSNLAAVESELDQFTEQQCPTCGQDIDHDCLISFARSSSSKVAIEESVMDASADGSSAGGISSD